MDEFCEVIQSSVKELQDLILQDRIHSLELKHYAEGILAYMLSDIPNLERLLNLVTSPEIIDCLGVRLSILKGSSSHDYLAYLTSVSQNNEWKGEKAFIIGLAHLDLKNNVFAAQSFKLAYSELWKIGAKKKAVKALMNMVVSEDRENNKQKCIPSYEYVKNKAFEVGDNIVAGLCAHNMAKEYHKLGALDLSLKYSNEALDLLSQDSGSFHFYDALLQRCHILIELSRFNEALVDFQKAKASPHIRIQEALKSIEVILGENKPLQLNHLEPAWRNKIIAKDSQFSKVRLTRLESLFIEVISKGPVSKDDLINILYGDKIDYLAADNRIKVFLTRFRKKMPGLLYSSNDMYFLTDNTLLRSIKDDAV